MPWIPRRIAIALVGAAGLATLSGGPWVLHAQATGSPGASTAPRRLDEGSFTVSINGQRAGREQFSVQAVALADGTALEVRSESAVGDHRVAMRLEADSAGTPIRYTVEEHRGADLTLRLGGQRLRGRFSTLARRPDGESAREYLLRPGAVVLEDDGIVQHAVLIRNRPTNVGAGVTLPSLTPIANTQGDVRVVFEADTDVLAIAGARVPARRWRCVTDHGELRLLWTDAEGHLLRLAIPSRNFDALRDDVPR